MPLTAIKESEVASIKRVGGKDEVRRRLENMEFISEADVTVVSINNGDVIVNVKDARIAISREMASEIII